MFQIIRAPKDPLPFVVGILVLWGWLAPSPAAASPRRFTLAECIATALAQHPSLAGARETVAAARARVGIARAATLPTLDLSASYTNTGIAAGSSDFGSARTSISHTGSSVMTFRQTLLDFGKRVDRVREGKGNEAAALSELEETRETVTFNVVKGYYGLLAARRLVEVNRESVAQFAQRLEQARGFFEVGKKPKIDVTKAEVDLSNARLELIKAENGERVARLELSGAMGFLEPPDYEIVEGGTHPKDRAPSGGWSGYPPGEMEGPGYPPGEMEGPVATGTLPDREEVVRRALARRPEVLQAQARRRAFSAALAAGRKGYLPELAGTAAYGWRSQRFPPGDPTWTLGLNFTYPIFTGNMVAFQVAEAEAQLRGAEALEANARLTVRLEVERAHSALREALERRSVAAQAEAHAEENFALAGGRYSVGLGSPIEYTDARTALTQARSNRIRAAYDALVAEAALWRAVGELGEKVPR